MAVSPDTTRVHTRAVWERDAWGGSVPAVTGYLMLHSSPNTGHRRTLYIYVAIHQRGWLSLPRLQRYRV